jgi:hypothetical protein
MTVQRVASRAVVFGLVLPLLVIPTAAEAVCTNTTISFAQYYNQPVSPGVNTPQSVVGAFWAFGFGNAADNGSFADEDGWIQPYAGAPRILGDWSQSPLIDGCIDGKIAPGKSVEIMVVELADRSPGFDSSFFAVAAVARDRFGVPQFDFSAGIGSDIILARVVRPFVVSSSQTELTLSGPSYAQLSGGFYSDGSVSLPELVVGYRLYSQTWTYGNPLPDVRRNGWTPATGTIPIGQNATVAYTCTLPILYYAYSLVYENGLESPYLSPKSNQISCSICSDLDGDGRSADPYCGELDCDDTDAHTYRSAVEINDGKDNECPGDAGYGIVDEVDGTVGFVNPGDKASIAWPPQGGATAYQVARSTDPAFAGGCTSFISGAAAVSDPASPFEGEAFYYVVRATAPHVGSWGSTSAGVERTTGCP